MSSRFKNFYARVTILLIALICLLLFCYRLSKVTQNTDICIYGVDFIAFHTAARLVGENSVQDIYISTGEDFGGIASGEFYQTAQSSGFEYNPTRYVYLPVFLAPFQLFSHYGFSDAAKYWLIMNLFLLLTIMVLQWRIIKDYFSPALGAMAVIVMNMMSFPLFYGLKLGQTTLVVYLAVCLIYYFTLKEKNIRAGVLLGLIVSLKYTPLIYVLYFLYRRKYVLAVSCAVTVASLVFLSIAVYGLPLHESYWSFITGLSEGGIAGWSNQSIQGVLLRQFWDFSALSYVPLKISSQIFFTNCILAGLVIIGVFQCIRKKKGAEISEGFPLEFSAITLCFLIISPVSWLHYFCLAILPALIIIGTCFKTNPGLRRSILISISMLSCILITFYTSAYRLILIFDKNPVSRLIISSSFTGACILLATSCFVIYSVRFSKNDLVKSPKTFDRNLTDSD